MNLPHIGSEELATRNDDLELEVLSEVRPKVRERREWPLPCT